MIAVVVSIVYSKWFINYPNQLLITERLLILGTLDMLLFAYYMYFGLPITPVVIAEILSCTVHILGYVIIQEEIIKYCSFAHPGTILYATAFLGLGRDIIEPIMVSFIGILYDQPVKTWTLAAQLIYTVLALLYTIFIS